MIKKIIIDLDNTITIDDNNLTYENKCPRLDVISKLHEYKSKGYTIVINTARNMRTYDENLDKIKLLTLPIILNWLALHDVPYDDVIIGKPWCGNEGFYVDDRAIRPHEFINLSPQEILDLIKF